jgi:hypothetical protein
MVVDDSRIWLFHKNNPFYNCHHTGNAFCDTGGGAAARKVT